MVIEQVLETLAKLVEFKSVTPKSSGSIEYIAKLLTSVGFNCDIQIFGETEEDKTANLYARYGNESPNICFAGHVDVVPPMNESLWDYSPFELKIVGEEVYGRGTVDMKGAIACAIVATLNYLNDNRKPNGSISFLLTSDEEGCAKYGTKPMLEYLAQKGEKIDFSILGEPTTKAKLGDTIKIGRRGSVNFVLEVTGKQGHVAYPHAAINPITSLVKIAMDLMNINFDNGSEFFEKTNLEMTSFDVENNVVNIIPEKSTLNFNVRFNDLHTAKGIFGTVLEIIAKHEVIFDLRYESSSEAFIQEYSERMKKFANIVKNQCNIEPEIDTNGGTSDARFIHKYSEIVEFGLSFDQAHKINEHTKISDLQSLYNVYYTSLVEFLQK
ncbi:MAG: succinyl-diaminopimelate desuccinylase [Rickettsiaceae bacterium]